MNKLILAALLIAVLPAHAAGPAPDLATILDENAEAHGASAYADIQSVRHRLLIKEPGFQVEGTYTATRDGRMRIDIYAGGKRVFAEGLDGDCGWAWQPAADGGEPEIDPCVGEKETAALRHGTQMPGHFFTLKDVGERGAKLELIGEEKTDSGAYWQVRVTLPDGFERDYFIDQETMLVAMGRDQRAFHPGIDPVEITVESRYENPRKLDGVLRYMKQENTNAVTGEWLGTTTVLTIEHNIDIPEGLFTPEWEAPASPRP